MIDSSTTSSLSPALRSFIPLLYVAWADGMLSPSEVKIIHEKIANLPELDDEDRDHLKKWTTPTTWPTEDVFKEWLRMIKQATDHVAVAELQSLADVGMRVADRNAIGDKQSRATARTREALEEIQTEIGLPGLQRFRSISREDQAPAMGGAKRAASLQRMLDGPYWKIKDQTRNLLSDPIFAFEKWPTKEEHRQRVNVWMKHLVDQGYGLLSYPKEVGGQSDMLAYAAVFETLAFHDLSLTIKFGVQFGLFGGSILNLGSARHHSKYLQAAGELKLSGCFAMTETGHGSNVRDLETLATYDPDTGMIDVHSPSFRAGKEFIGNALDSRMASVFAQLIVQGENHGVHAVLVPLRDASGSLMEGIRVEDNGYKMGLNGVDNGRIWFDHVKVPRENLLDRYGRITPLGRYESPIANPAKRFFTMLGTLVGGRICVGKAGLSAAKVALTIAVKYANRRRQFGPDRKSEETLLLDYPSHQRRLIPRIARVYAANFALEGLMLSYDRSDEVSIRQVETTAAGLKSYATWLATDTIQECREACGGKGYLWENRFSDLKADSDIFTTFEGDNTVLMQLVAKGLLSNFKDEFNNAGVLGIYRYLRDQAADTLIAIDPIYKRKTDADHLLDHGFFDHAFHFRERKLLHTLAGRMRKMLRKRITPYDIFLRTQTHMVALAHAHVERLILQEFARSYKEVTRQEEKQLLAQVYALFALSTIEEHKGWYLEQDYMESVKTKAIRRQVDRLCKLLRPEAETLVDCFGIPAGLVSAPIAIESARQKP